VEPTKDESIKEEVENEEEKTGKDYDEEYEELVEAAKKLED